MAGSAESLPLANRTRRWGLIWAWLGVVAVTLLIVAVVSVKMVLGGYEPLENGSVFGVDGARFRRVGFGVEPMDAVFRYQHGQVATVKFGLRNTGRWAVRIDRLLQPFQLDAETMKTPMQPIGVLTGPLITETKVITPPLSRYQPFESFTLAPGEERMMAIQYRFEDCGNIGEGGTFTSTNYTVSYSTLWVHNTMEVAFPYHLVIQGPIKGCPSA